MLYSCKPRITDEFIDTLKRLEADLHRAAIEDHWPVEWPNYEDVFRKAQDAVERRYFGRALIEYGRLFDLLMAAIQLQRKQQQQKPKKGSAPAIATVKEPESNPALHKTKPENKLPPASR